MRTMHARAILLSLGLAASLCAASAPVRAQFYDLDGAYHCLAAPDPACKGEAAVPPARPAPAAPITGPTLNSVIADIRAQKVTAGDMQLLGAQAARQEPRAIEALAWCKLNGLGGAADPLAAYSLYGEAAQLGVPNAQANQIAIFETRLTPAQRQELLVKLQSR